MEEAPSECRQPSVEREEKVCPSGSVPSAKQFAGRAVSLNGGVLCALDDVSIHP